MSSSKETLMAHILAASGINWGIVTVYTVLGVATGLLCGYVAGKIAESSGLSFSLFFILGLVFDVLGILIAIISRMVKKMRVKRRYRSPGAAAVPLATPDYYQPSFLEEVPPESLAPPPSEGTPTETARCPACDAGNAQTNECCRECGAPLMTP